MEQCLAGPRFGAFVPSPHTFAGVFPKSTTVPALPECWPNASHSRPACNFHRNEARSQASRRKLVLRHTSINGDLPSVDRTAFVRDADLVGRTAVASDDALAACLSSRKSDSGLCPQRSRPQYAVGRAQFWDRHLARTSTRKLTTIPDAELILVLDRGRLSGLQQAQTSKRTGIFH